MDDVNEAATASEHLAGRILDVIEEDLGDMEGGLIVALVALEQLLAAVATSAMETQKGKSVEEVVIMIAGHLHTMMTNMLKTSPDATDDPVLENATKIKRRMH